VAKKKLDWYKMYPKDFDTDEAVKLMGLMEIGLFVMLLNHAWSNKSIPSDPESLARIARIPRVKFDPLWKLVSKCFVAREDGRLVNPRQEEERDEAKERSAHGKNGAEARWKGMPKRCSTDARASIEHQSSNATRVLPLLSASEKGSGEGLDVEDWFERIYSRHPKKGDKHLAQQYAVEALGGGRIDPALFERRHAAWCASEEWTWKNGARAPKLAQWILDEGWLYEPPGGSAEPTSQPELPLVRAPKDFVA
jgi:uncharacterized protein YdaU (DUF1376 family)